MSKLNSLNVSLDDQLKDYSFKRSFLKNHHPFRYWSSNKNLFIHLTYWVFFFWAFLVIFAIFVPINNTSRVGRGAMVVFETAFNYIVKIFRKHVRTQDNEAANLSPAIWSFESYLFLFWTIALVLVSFYCRFIINNFIHEITEILREKNITHVEKKFKRFYKFIKILTIISTLLIIWTAFALLYIKKPVNSKEIYTFLFQNPESTSRMYHRPLTKAGWITGGLNIFFFLVASFFYFKYSREKLTGNDFFFKCFRPVDASIKNTIPVDLKIQNDIRKSLKVLAGQNFKKKNTEGYVAELKNVNKYFLVGNNQFHALKNVNLTIKKGEFIVILGYSGSGKTTLLNILAGIDRPTNGECILGDCDISKMTDMDLNQFRRKKIGYIFQNYALLPNLTAVENISITQSINKKIPVKMKYRKFKENMKVARGKEEKIKALKDFMDDLFFSQTNEEELNYLVDVLNLADHRNKYPHQLSGGQQQRVAIARAFIKKPTILLADEPTGAIDHSMTKSILELFYLINKYAKTTVIIITHNKLIAQMAQRILYVENGMIVKDIINQKPKMVNEIKGL